MPYIKLPPDAPGIVGLLDAYPATGRYLRGLAETLLRGPSSLSSAERELIAAAVSAGNECVFCTQSHAAAARNLLGEREGLMDQVLYAPVTAADDARLGALLNLAEQVRRDGRLVTPEDIDRARRAGADDQAIHDTVLIASAFCMFNRYVDGLGTWTPTDQALYSEMGQRMARDGYQRNSPE